MTLTDILGYVILGPIYYVFTIKTKTKTPEPSPLQAPNITVGATIPVLFGSRTIKEPLITWWGDVKILKVKPPAGAKK